MKGEGEGEVKGEGEDAHGEDLAYHLLVHLKRKKRAEARAPL